MKINRKVLPFKIYGSLDSETPVEVLPQGFFTTLTNFYPKNGVVKKRGGISAIGSPIASGTMTGLHTVRSGNVDVLFRMYNDSGNKIDKWTGTAWTIVTTGLANSNTVTWDLAKYYYETGGVPYEAVVITNNSNYPALYYGTTYAELNTLVTSGTKYPKTAKFVEEIDGYLMTFNITENDTPSVSRKNRIRWCKLYDIATWEDDSYQDILGSGEITGVCRFNSELYVFTARSVTRVTPTGDEDVPFAFTYNIIPFGTLFHDSILEVKNKILYLGIDRSIRAFDGFKSVVLSEAVSSKMDTTPTNAWVAFDEADAQYLLYTSSGILSLDLGNQATTEIQSLNYGLETYAGTDGTPKFLTTYNNLPYAVQGKQVVKLHDNSAYADVGNVAITASLVTGYIPFGDRLEAKVGKVRLYSVFTGVDTAGNTGLTITGFGPSTTTTNANIISSVTGMDIEVNKWAKQLQFTIEHSSKVGGVRLNKLEIEILNSRQF